MLFFLTFYSSMGPEERLTDSPKNIKQDNSFNTANKSAY